MVQAEGLSKVEVQFGQPKWYNAQVSTLLVALDERVRAEVLGDL